MLLTLEFCIFSFTWYRGIKSYSKMEELENDSNFEVLTKKRSLDVEEKNNKSCVSNILQDKSNWFKVGTELVI